MLVLPDDTAGHSLAAAIESAMLAPKGQLSMYPWKDTPEKIPLAVRHVRSFLLALRLRSILGWLLYPATLVALSGAL